MKLTDKISVELSKFVCSHAYDIIIPNFYYGGFEMDLMRINRGGKIFEYEIKVSRADYFKDFQKGFEVVGTGNNWRSRQMVYKHERLAAKNTVVNRFWFVTPAGMLDVKEIPKHAGLLVYRAKENKFEVVKPAPLLNKGKHEIDYKNICNKMARRELVLKQKLCRKQMKLS